ncbi:MAG: Type restriction-modification enzyme R/helicase subunit [Actinomycetia bacterium]|nr:Type restriction-modification enzyme R/helicase subunit [Actinomycetes bacterium]
MPTADLSNPILNSPYHPPEAHFEIGQHGPTGTVLPGRRPSESFIPVPVSKKKGKVDRQEALDFDATGERREQNTLINDIRREVERWRAGNWNGVTPYTRKLLTYWADREEPVLFCQREAVETAIFLTEVAGRHGTADYRRRLEPENAVHNDGLPRVALKMATGSGKTVVMAMLIAWQTINKVHTPKDARFAKRFLIVTPGITIRDRLGVLHPERDDSYYRERDLIPNELWDALAQAQVEIVNYHAFLPRDAKEIQGVSANTRKLLRGGRTEVADTFRETPDQVATRVLKNLPGSGEILVFNDEAHHCYQDKLLDDTDEGVDKEDQDRNRDARVWFRGLHELKRKVGIKTIYDLSATPYYLKGSGYNEGFIFPWVVSDFSLMDAIESGIVKIPRPPVDDDAKGDQVVYLHLWDHIDPPLPKRRSSRDAEVGPGGWIPPSMLEGALKSLYRSYEQRHADYEATLAELGEPPPVLIVVCPNTVVSKLVFDWIAGREVILDDDTARLVPGELPLLSNVEDGAWAIRQRTILVDSAQLETEEPLGAEFKQAAAREIELFKQAYRLRNPGADVDKLTDKDLLREVMNTIGKKGKLGEQIRCVVSVAMLTEGWDANTVTHILGVRPFRSQLLCEQVVGRGLRRRSYAVNEDGRFEPEYAEIYGVPFAFIPSDRDVPKPKDPRAALKVEALDDRHELRITFPKLDGYRVELPDEALHADFTDESKLHLDNGRAALWVERQGVIGEADTVDLTDYREARAQRVAYEIARTMLQREDMLAAHAGAEKPWLFPQLVDIVKRWLDGWVTTEPDTPKGTLLLAQAREEAAEKVYRAITRYPDARRTILLPVIRRFDPEGSTDDVRFVTRKAAITAERSHVSHVVLDGATGNTWEQQLAGMLEVRTATVASYVKNDHLDFAIPYVHEGRRHEYLPDFLVRLVRKDADDVERTLVVEVSGSRKSPGPTKAKAETARDQWCASVNNDGRWGRWGYVELTDMTTAGALLDTAIANLYADAPIIGLPTED